MNKLQNISVRKLVFRLGILLAVFNLFLSGCDHNNRILDPKQIGRFRPVPAVNVILDSLGVEDEEPSAFEGAQEPLLSDAVVDGTDYTFSSGDILRIIIFELLQDSQTFQQDYIINETGKINIMEVGVVDAGGLTERQLEEEIRNILRPNVLKEPLVNVLLLSSQKHRFSISGDGVRAPGRYQIPRYDFKLLDAIALAGGIGQFNVSYVYVSRSVKERETMAEPFEMEFLEPVDGERMIVPEQEMLRMIMPETEDDDEPGNEFLMTSSEMVTDRELLETVSPGGLDLLRELSGLESGLMPGEEAGRVEWIFKDGKWVPVEVGRPRELIPDFVEKPVLPSEFAWAAETEEGPKARLIKIPAEKLMAGDPRYNIVIKEGDSIQVPVDLVGEFWVMGNVNSVGAFRITGRPLTLKMAIAAAGGLNELAWPKHCEITRRIGKNKEEIVMVNLDKIARGEQPDFFIKPHDLINVGTHPTSQWRYQLRNAFRATYGFAFIYDKNFAHRDFGFENPLGPFSLTWP